MAMSAAKRPKSAAKRPNMLMEHKVDPAKAIVDAVGNLDKFRVMANRILLGVYELPEKTKSGIILTDRYRGESEHQGKAMLVLKMGSRACVSDDHYTFHPDDVVEV